MVSTRFLRVCRQWHPRNTISPCFFFNLKKLRVIFCFKNRGKFVLHFGLIGFVLATLFACTLRVQILAWASGAWRPYRYAHLPNDCAIILNVISTIKFCQTFEHRYEILQFWGQNLPQETVSTVAGAILGVFPSKFGGIQV